MGRIAKPATLIQIATITTENFDTKNLMKINEINLSKDVVEALKDCKDVEKSKFRLDYRNHFKEIGLRFLRKTCYQNYIVKCVKVIDPSRILDAISSDKMMKVANSLPFKVSSTFIDEWTLVKAEQKQSSEISKLKETVEKRKSAIIKNYIKVSKKWFESFCIRFR